MSLNTCLWLLDKAQLATPARANPVRVTRCIAAMVRYSECGKGKQIKFNNSIILLWVFSKWYGVMSEINLNLVVVPE